MALSIGRVETVAEREAIYAFRYRVYVEEAAMTSEADHDRRMLYDAFDETAVSYAVHEDGAVVGSLRVILLEDVPEPAPLVAKFGLGPLLDAFGAGAVCTTSRFILDRRLRHGTVIFRLMRAAFRETRDRGVRFNFGDCSPHMLPLYEHLGFRRYTRGYNDTAYGYKIPIVMLMGDREQLRRVRSPLARLADEAPDDEGARAWFEATYPDYVGLESAAFMPEDVFFDLLAGRVADAPLHSVSLLRGLERAEAEKLLARASLIKLGKGDLIIRKGEKDDTIYLLLSGIAEVTLDDPDAPPVAIIGAGDTFGEIGFLTSVPRTANVVASAECEVLVLSGEFLERFISSEPAIGAKLLLNLSRELAARLAVTTERAHAGAATD